MRSLTLVDSLVLDHVTYPGDQHPQISFGGVCKNMACVLGLLNLKPRFISPMYTAPELALEFQSHGVAWQGLGETEVAMATFKAHLDHSGKITAENFELPPENGWHDVFRAPNLPEFLRGTLVISSTNLPTRQLKALEAAAEKAAGILAIMVGSLQNLSGLLEIKPQILGLNFDELNALHPCEPDDFQGMADLMLNFLKPHAESWALVTLGSRGALFVLPDFSRKTARFFHHASLPVQTQNFIGAGDVCFARFLGDYLSHLDGLLALQAAIHYTANYLKGSHLPHKYLLGLKGQIL